MEKLIFNNQKGMITLEMLIAMAVMVLIISSVVSVTFSNQMITVDAQTNHEALLLAQQKIEIARQTASVNFNSLVTNAYGFSSGSLMYLGNDTITDISPCLKQLSTKLNWSMESRSQYSQLDTLLSSPTEAQAMGGDCATEPPSGGWTNPNSYTSADITPGGNEGTDVKVININGNKYAFLTSVHNNPASDDFWIFDVGTNPPTLLKSLDTGLGLNAVDVAKGNDGKYYAFVASNDTTNQFQVITLDFDNMANTQVIKNMNTTDDVATSIYFYDDKVYVGHNRNSGVGQQELHVFGVLDPTDPSVCATREMNHNVNKIVVSGDTIYMATSSNDAELTALTISGCTITPPFVLGTPDPGYNAPGDSDGTALDIVGSHAFLGRERDNNEDDFFILDIINPSFITLKGSKDFDLSLCDRKDGQGLKPCLGPNTKISDMVIVAHYAFLAATYTTGGFQAWDIINPADIVNLSTFNYSEKATGVEYLDDYVYVSNQSQNALRVIRPAECADKIDDDGDSNIDSADLQCYLNGVYNPEDDDEQN